MTLREGARLQTFADDFLFSGTQEEIAALIGNAVPPLLAEVIGGAILHHLRDPLQGRAAAVCSRPSLPAAQLALFEPMIGAT
jgi:DNA (cytosine-5)-methyltransferase 1